MATITITVKFTDGSGLVPHRCKAFLDTNRNGELSDEDGYELTFDAQNSGTATVDVPGSNVQGMLCELRIIAAVGSRIDFDVKVNGELAYCRQQARVGYVTSRRAFFLDTSVNWKQEQ